MTQRHNTTLDQTTVSTLRAYGGGNLSEGIRRAAELVNASHTTTESEGVTRPNWVTHHGCGRPEGIDLLQWVVYQSRNAIMGVGQACDLDWRHEDHPDDIMVYTVTEQRKEEKE